MSIFKDTVNITTHILSEKQNYVMSLVQCKCSVVEVDILDVMIKITKQKAERIESNVEFHIIDLRDLNPDARFNACI